MADPASYRPAPGSIPESPGVYRFRDGRGRVIYVGKAKSLRQRLNSYFADFANLHPRTQAMVTSASSVDWTVVGPRVATADAYATAAFAMGPAARDWVESLDGYEAFAVTPDGEQWQTSGFGAYAAS